MTTSSKRQTVDLTVQNEGSIFLLRGVSNSGEDWIAENIPDDATTWGDAIVVEHRYIQDIIDGARAAGLTVEPA